MTKEDPKVYCYMARKGLACVKLIVAKRHLPHYECEKCIWRVNSEEPRHLRTLDKMFEKYGNKEWK